MEPRIAVHERADEWMRFADSVLPPHRVVPAPGPMRASLTWTQVGDVRFIDMEATAGTVAHIPDPSDPDDLLIGILRAGSTQITGVDRSRILSRGDLTMYDPSRPYTKTYPAPFRQRLISIPRSELGLSSRVVASISAERFSSSHPLVPVIRRFSDALVSGDDDADPGIGSFVALVRAVAAARAGRDDLARAPLDAVIPDRLERLVEHRLREHDLGPRQAAEALGVSLRTLQRILARREMTFGRLLVGRRVEAASRDLTNTFAPIAEIAARNGFPTASAFSRIFREHVGMSPRAYRQANIAD